MRESALATPRLQVLLAYTMLTAGSKQGFDSGVKHDGQHYLSQEGCACGAHHISDVGASKGSDLGTR